MIRILAYLLLLFFLGGCTAQKAYNDGLQLIAGGKPDDGLLRLEEASRLKPANAEYRIAYLTRRIARINELLTVAESLRREGQLNEAEKAYQHVLRLDSAQILARQGVQAIVTERRHRQVISDADTRLRKEGDNTAIELMFLVERVLAENPAQKDALNLKGRLEQIIQRNKVVPPELAESFRKPITISFKDASLKAVFDVVSEVSGLNFVFDKDLRPDLKTSIQAKKSSIEEVVRILLLTNQLEYRVLSKNALLIYPGNPQKYKDYRPLAVRTFYLANADVKAVAGTLKTILKTADLMVDERLSLIIVRDTPDAIKVAERLVALQDIADPEVMLEVEILEIKRSRLLELGIDWPDQTILSPLPASGSTLTLRDLKNLSSATTGINNLSTSINLRKEDQDGNILANPRIRVRNKEKAKVMIGDRVPVITTTSTSTGFVSETVSYVDVGLKLEVEPNIYLDEEVGIKVNLEVSNLVREVTSQGGTLAYQIGTRNANTVLRLRDGETQILAGLISNEDRSSASKIPGLGELPLLGRLFGSKKNDKQRSEIVLSITPRLIRSIRRPDLDAASFDAGTEAQVGMPVMLLQNSAEEDTSVNASTPERLNPVELASTEQTQEKVSPQATTKTEGITIDPELTLHWGTLLQPKIGQVFHVDLDMSSKKALQSLALAIQYDQGKIQLLSIEEGGFFSQAGSSTSFGQKIDSQNGKAFVTALRKTGSINGKERMARFTFKAMRSGETSLLLLSASPIPEMSWNKNQSPYVIKVLP